MGEPDSIRRSELVECVRPWAPLILRHAREAGLAPSLVGAVVAQESSGRQYAQRVERGFASRYAAGIARWVKSTVTKADDLWSRYPDIYCSSLGLMQPMIQTAAEHGFTYTYPGELFDPETNLRVGCNILRRKIDRAHGNLSAGLLAYNGGGNPKYPDEVLHKQAALEVSAHDLGWA